MKKALSIVLALIMCLSLLPTAALGVLDFYPDPVYSGDFQIEGTTLVKYTGPDNTDIVIPDGIIKIGDRAFAKLHPGYAPGPDVALVVHTLGHVTFPDSLREIGNEAFASCDIKNFTFPRTVTRIEEGAFRDVQFTGGPIDLVIPGSLTHIPAHAFDWFSGVRSITLEEGVETVGESAFGNGWQEEKRLTTSGTSVKDVRLPESLTSIGEEAFAALEPVNPHSPLPRRLHREERLQGRQPDLPHRQGREHAAGRVAGRL